MVQRVKFGVESAPKEETPRAQAEAEQVVQIKDEHITSLVSAMEGIDNAPDYDTILEWKETWGVIYTSTIAMDQDFYIFRTLKRVDYKKMVASGAAKSEDKFEEGIIRKCLLWPNPDAKFIAESDAGVVSTLATQIKFKSGFIPDQLAVELIKVL